MTNKAEQVFSGASHKKMNATKALVVIDKYIVGETFKRMLEEWNYNITGVCAASKEALIKVKEIKPDLILTDIELKDCNGIRLVKQLNLQSEQAKLCIYFTAYATDLIVQRTINAANALDYSVNKSTADKFARNFEASFCRHYGIDQTTIYAKKKEFATQPIRVLLVDDQQIVLWGLEKLIGNERPAMEVVGTATNSSEAKQLVMEKQPDVVVLNISLGEEDCINLIPDFAHNGTTRVVIFTETHDKEIIDRAILSGARGVVHKKEPMHTIVRAIEKIHEGELWLDRITTGRIFLQNSRRGKMGHDADAEKISTLTRKECVILRAFSDGVGGEQNKQIAAKLCMSEHTLRNHLTSIFSKLGIKNRFTLFAYAKQHFQQSAGLSSTSKPPTIQI